MDFGIACAIVLPTVFFGTFLVVYLKGEISRYLTRSERILREATAIVDYLVYIDICYIEDEEPMTLCEYFCDQQLYEEYRNHEKRLKEVI